MDLRNPFRIRTAERIDSDETFLQLFGPDALELLQGKSGLFDKVQLFCSAPGAGKTSLLRVFTPSVLSLVCDTNLHEGSSELFRRLKLLDVVGDEAPTCIGVMLSLARNYAKLEDIAGDRNKAERLLFALLNARLLLVALRGICVLKKLTYPQDLSRITFDVPRHNELPAGIPIPCTGQAVLSWATEAERAVCRALDSFGVQEDVLQGHDTLYSLQILNPQLIRCDGKKVAQRTLVMFDDFQELTEFQRDSLRQTLVKLRPPVGIWIAERIEALNPEVMFGGATEGREYENTIYFEDFWRSGTQFEKAVNNIADRRAKMARDVQITDFSAKLMSAFSQPQSDQLYRDAAEKIAWRVRQQTGVSKRYEQWINKVEAQSGSSYDSAISWRSLEILIERDKKNTQLTLGLDVPLSVEDLQDFDSAIRAAADFLVADEFGIPYYFGSHRLATLSSYNIDQFLSFAGDLFEEIISGELINGQGILSPGRQEDILKQATERKWTELPKRAENGRDVRNFLTAIYDCAKWEMDKGTASYGAAGAATGIGLTMRDRDILISPEQLSKKPENQRLVRTMSFCIANNLLDPSLGRSQGAKDKKWMILYLNRWLCLHFGLPLQSGGWRPKSPSELATWVERGFVPPDKTERQK